MADEVWKTRDGTEIAVGDMSEGHVRNALRMILRKDREARKKRIERLSDVLFGDIDPQVFMNDQHRRDLANPRIFFPLLDGGVHGSDALHKKHSGSI